jgi:hypothetical protein
METSTEAYVKSRSNAEKHRNIIMSVMENHRKPMSSEQISIHCILTHPQVWRRMSELADDFGLIERTKDKTVNSSQYHATLWKLKTNQQKLEL